MITVSKVLTYKRYNGELEAWSHGSRQKERLIMNDADWYAIQSLLQDIKLINGGQASDSFKDDAKHRLNAECEDKGTINLLLEEAARLWGHTVANPPQIP